MIIKSCHFCGELDKVEVIGTKKEHTRQVWQVICFQCGATTRYNGVKVYAVMDWNRRALSVKEKEIDKW